MTDSDDKKIGDKMPLYCDDCQEERIFVWSTWSGVVYFGYPAASEFGWECTMCGNRLRVT